MDEELHRLSCDDEFARFVLCFPANNCREFGNRLEALRSRGFTHLVERGKQFMNYRIVGKGYSSILVLALNENYGLGLIKVRRTDSRRETLEREGVTMDYLEKTGSVPRVYAWGKDFVFMEYLENCNDVNGLIEFMASTGDVSGLVRVLRKVLYTLHLFDLMRVDHAELGRPRGHIYWCNGVVKVIDWESSRLSERPRNLTSFISYLMYRSSLSASLSEVTSSEERERLISALKNYKNEQSTVLARDIVNFLQELLHRLY